MRKKMRGKSDSEAAMVSIGHGVNGEVLWSIIK